MEPVDVTEIEGQCRYEPCVERWICEIDFPFPCAGIGFKLEDAKKDLRRKYLAMLSTRYGIRKSDR